MREYPGVSVFVFTLLLSAFVLFFDSRVGPKLVWQFVSRNYPRVAGRITQSELVEKKFQGRKTVYDVNIAYHYEINGQPFDAARFRYNNLFSELAEGIVGSRPVGSQTTVYYNPRNPRDAILSPGIAGSDVMEGMLFLIPFNIMMIGLWIIVANWLRRIIFKPVAGGIRVHQTNQIISAELPPFLPILVAVYVVGAVSVAVAVVVVLSFGTNPPFGVAGTCLYAPFCLGAGFYCWSRRKIRSGDWSVVWDKERRVVILPKTFGRKERVTVERSALSAVTVEAVSHFQSGVGISYTYAPMLRLRDRASESQKLAQWRDQSKAEAFACWLRRQLNL